MANKWVTISWTEYEVKQRKVKQNEIIKGVCENCYKEIDLKGNDVTYAVWHKRTTVKRGTNEKMCSRECCEKWIAKQHEFSKMADQWLENED